ncbi:methylase [Longilinea arvoryzae]|uniref:Methylase n=1 Tax=Longilinea arvoryzae TaxID=360412 RepID=A0A0K8MZQ1_9CHLR|nr:class I SAM-dependent methyltransferase [Longilinea arvoryzae]GAP16132.1 methylase [Longilinea arvoryzae]
MDIHEERSMKSYNQKADNYDDTPDGKFTYRFKEQLVKIIRIPEGGSVLDIACGNGRLLQMLSRGHHFSGYGVDISEKMVENARRIDPGMVFETARCNQLPFEAAFFDVVTVCAAFHHFPDIAGFAKEAFRVVKPNGMLYIAEVYYPAFFRTIFNPFIRFMQEGDVKLYAPEEITRLLQRTGFTNEVLRIEDNIQVIGARRRAG